MLPARLFGPISWTGSQDYPSISISSSSTWTLASQFQTSTSKSGVRFPSPQYTKAHSETNNHTGANSTGVYSGALAVVNGNGGVNDKANLNRAFLRGIQKTDADGVVQFDTNFPGHYAGRATHIHMISHVEGAQAKENNTLWNLRVRHAGQVFFDQDLITAVEATAPYNTNRQSKTLNKNDAILIQETANKADPFFEYVQLSSNIKDGVFGWFSLGVNMTYTRTIMAVAQKFKEGGKMVTTNPKVPGLDAIFPGGFPTAFQPGFGGAAAAVETGVPRRVVKERESGEAEVLEGVE